MFVVSRPLLKMCFSLGVLKYACERDVIVLSVCVVMRGAVGTRAWDV